MIILEAIDALGSGDEDIHLREDTIKGYEKNTIIFIYGI